MGKTLKSLYISLFLFSIAISLYVKTSFNSRIILWCAGFALVISGIFLSDYEESKDTIEIKNMKTSSLVYIGYAWSLINMSFFYWLFREQCVETDIEVRYTQIGFFFAYTYFCVDRLNIILTNIPSRKKIAKILLVIFTIVTIFHYFYSYIDQVTNISFLLDKVCK